jgi:serine/threonine protein kinase/tetratricopeptide (TPR) repeat protein
MKEDLILAKALAIEDVGARSAFLDRACADQPDVRAKIEQQIARRRKTNTGPAERPDPANTTGPFPAAQEQTGPFAKAAGQEGKEWAFLEPSAAPGALGRLGHYEVLGVIGRGGMGAVLKAHDEKLQRVVALKVMSAALRDDPAARQRFVREARLAAAVTHDHIVAIYAVEDAGPVPYLVMPLIAGHSLQQEIDTRGPLPTAEVVRIGMEIAEGLEAAHSHELIHRDIKPANILLEDGSGRVKITDFGLARAGDDASITQSGLIVGTPMYMSPEQAEGKKLDPRSDLFSFGSVLYALCTGRPPFQAKSTVAVLRRVCDSEPRPVRDINPDVPKWLEKVILGLLQKHRADRYQTAGEVAAVLRDHVTERAKPSKPPPLPKGPAAPRTKELKRHARKDTMIAAPAPPSRKKPLIIGGVLGLAGLLVAGTLVAWIVYGGARGPGDNPSVKDDAAGKPVVKGDAAGQPEPGKGMPDKLLGSWKGRVRSVFAPGGEFDTVATFNKDGTWREEVFDLQGRSGGGGTGRWQFRDGEISIFYDKGFFRRATVTWIDNDTMDLRTVETRPPNPVLTGQTVQFRRQGNPDALAKKDGAAKAEPAKGTAAKLVGSWKSPHPNDPRLGWRNTYNKDGSFHSEPLDRQGRSIGPPFTGRWELRAGKIHTFMDSTRVRYQRTTVTWIDDDTIDLRIVETRPPIPAQPTVRFRRETAQKQVRPRDQDRPDVASQLLATEQACKGKWKAAAAAYARVFAVQPLEDGELGFEYAAVLLLSGDQAGYRKMCAEMLKRSGWLKVRPYHVARACTLAPDSVKEAALPGKLAALELQQNRQEFWSLTEQGALAYRAGRFDEAAMLLEKSLQADRLPARAVLNWLWLSLVEHRRRKPAEAQAWLAKATKWLEQYPKGVPVAPDDATGLHLHNWLEAQVLRREAEALLVPKK